MQFCVAFLLLTTLMLARFKSPIKLAAAVVLIASVNAICATLVALACSIASTCAFFVVARIVLAATFCVAACCCLLAASAARNVRSVFAVRLRAAVFFAVATCTLTAVLCVCTLFCFCIVVQLFAARSSARTLLACVV